MLLPNAKLSLAAIWALLLVSLTGCASNSATPPGASLQLPPPPSLSTPLPSVDYSLTAAEAIKNWRAKLTATRMMSESTATPGR